RQQKAKPSGKREEQDSSTKTEGNPSQNSETSNTTLKGHNSKSSRGYNASKAPSFRNVTTHGHKLPKQDPPIMTEKQGECEVQSESVHELHIQAPQVVPSANDQDPHETQSEEEENESGEGHVPLELFAELIEMQLNECSVCVSMSSVSTGCDDKELSTRQKALSDDKSRDKPVDINPWKNTAEVNLGDSPVAF
ncbi:hypothetical protein DPX16_9237, partial [Anabarilius grahami]